MSTVKWVKSNAWREKEEAMLANATSGGKRKPTKNDLPSCPCSVYMDYPLHNTIIHEHITSRTIKHYIVFALVGHNSNKFTLSKQIQFVYELIKIVLTKHHADI